MNGPSARSLTLIDLALEEDLGRVGDITARACERCNAVLIDAEAKLKQALHQILESVEFED